MFLLFTSCQSPGTIDAHENDFAWGYTVGGGLERQIGRHWSLKTEYLFYDLGDRTFSSVNSADGLNYRWRSDNQGHIIRAGLNFRF
jgi:outer membrane immunogenic protein